MRFWASFVILVLLTLCLKHKAASINDDICKLPKDEGYCRALVSRWYYDHMARSCQHFFYGGCGGNSNNFKSKVECMKNCRRSDICQLPEDQGPCRGFLARWFFNKKNKRCEAIVFGGCGGNANIFKTKLQCMIACSNKAFYQVGIPGFNFSICVYMPQGKICSPYCGKQ
ncbi:BPTI/Kunitz domain-containing protein-like [Gracilinanus agilis]|uniref:BPTI/Kunitz domain-containing protein-like n=1 Tax=Gracilinanus agilis TaxID=191870 RepID=UPI001CFCB2B6|nr:BPTI/Kunitz domain-containing protein-like [Gracilinanus agilis]